MIYFSFLNLRMKKNYKIKKLITFSLLFLAYQLNLISQIQFNIESPATIAGSFGFSTTADPGVSTAGWTATPDLNDSANAVLDTLMFVEDSTTGTNPQGNPISQEGCNPLINDLTGKIAVIWRNTCEFGTKILNAENAGARAVIIINREPGLVNIAPGADGGLVTIPAVFVDSADGAIIANEMANGPVVAFMGYIPPDTNLYTYIPDQNFEQELINLGYDNLIDQYVLTSDISGVTDLFLNGIGVSDLTGVEDFSSLTTLECEFNQLSSLDLSQNSNLTFLNCSDNQLTTLDVSQNSNLTSLSCQYNQLTNLNINGLSNLLDLNCEVNQLTSLDVSQNPNLFMLHCYANQLTTLIVNGANNLVDLYCSDNQLTTLDLSNNIALNTLNCSMNQITTLDVNQSISLSQFDCYNNQIVSLDLSNNIALTYLNCSGNNLNCLNVKNGYNLNLNISADFNDSLTCVEVDNVSYSTAAWSINVDPQTSFSLDCIGCGCDLVYTIDTLNTNVADIQFQNYSPQTYLAISDTFPQFSNPNCDSIVSTYRQLIYNPNYFTDTILTYDTLNIYDTLITQVFDSLTVYDTIYIDIIDTSYVSISVTDTLYIDITVTGMTSIDNTITVYPNPANDVVIIDNGNYSIMNNYNLMIFNSLSQQVFFSPINTQQFQIPVSSLGAEGTYIIQIFDSTNNLIKTKYLILN
jgi:hypothetical protein